MVMVELLNRSFVHSTVHWFEEAEDINIQWTVPLPIRIDLRWRIENHWNLKHTDDGYAQPEY